MINESKMSAVFLHLKLKHSFYSSLVAMIFEAVI